MDYDKYAVQTLETVTLFEPASGKCLAILDEIKDASLEGAADTIWATGASGKRLSSFKTNKTLVFNCNNGYIVGGLLAQQFGGAPEVADTTATIPMPAFEYLTVEDGGTTALTKNAAIGTVGDEIGWIYKMNKDRSQGQEYAQAAAATATEFSYDPATREITLPTDVFQDGDEIIVFYEYLSKGVKFIDRSDVYAGDAKAVFDYLVKDPCDASLRHAMFVMPRGTISDNFSFSFGSDFAVHPFSIEAAADICSKTNEYGYWIFPSE